MHLKRTLNLPLLTFYGLGSIIGAGIYALIGSVAQEAKLFTPFSFLIAAGIALLTAATYAELSSRFPQSAGASLYARKAFHKRWLSGMVGWLVVSTGIISSAALLHGIIAYLQVYFSISTYFLIPVIIILLTSITVWGITESAVTIFLMTSLEVLGLLIIIWYGKDHFIQNTPSIKQFIPNLNLTTWTSILMGAMLAFYAFIGFEDMVNLAEETKNPEKLMPLAIFLAAIFATVLYVIISFITVLSLSNEDLLATKTPLNLIIQRQGHSPLLFSIIAIISIANGILVNILMASRLIYGMTKLNNAPQIFAKIYKKTQIPLLSTLVVMLLIILCAYIFPIKKLAAFTSMIMLSVFCLMHLALIKLKITLPQPKNQMNVPLLVPITGFLLSSIFLIFSFIA